jgi:hypothetical protein
MKVTDERLENFMTAVYALLHNERTYALRRRLNPHHPEEHQLYEAETFRKKHQEQLQDIKVNFVSNRTSLYKEAEDTGSVSALETLKALDRVIDDEMDFILLGDKHE